MRPRANLRTAPWVGSLGPTRYKGILVDDYVEVLQLVAASTVSSVIVVGFGKRKPTELDSYVVD